MGPGADAADMADRPGHFFYWPALAKFLKTAQVLNMELGIDNIACIVQGDGNPTVAFDPGYWLNIDHFAHSFHLLITPVSPAAPSGCHGRRYNGSSWPADPTSIWGPTRRSSGRPSYPPSAGLLCGWARNSPGRGSGPECIGAPRFFRRNLPASPSPCRGN